MKRTTMWRILAALALLAVVAVAVSPKARQVADSGGVLPSSTWST